MYIYLILRQNWDRPSYKFWLSQGRAMSPGARKFTTYSMNQLDGELPSTCRDPSW